MEASQPGMPAEIPPLTQEQGEMADFFVAECGLEAVADEQLTMMGASGTVRYGLGRCAEHIGDLSPDEIRDMVLAKLEQQKQNTEAAGA